MDKISNPNYNKLPKGPKHIEAQAIERLKFSKTQVKPLLVKTDLLPAFVKYPSNDRDLYIDIKLATAKGYITWDSFRGRWV